MNMNNENLNGLNEQIESTTNKLTELKTEQAEFQSRMAAAVGAGDPDTMIELRRRQGEIPDGITIAQIQLARLQLEADQERLPLLEAQVAKSAEPIEAAVLKRDAAVLELNKLQGAYHTANEDFRDLRIRVGERTRELARLIHLANPAREIPGTKLRSLNSH
jgi:chromosome segregation ATPase